MTVRKPELTHEALASSFDRVMNSYDLDRRLGILIDRFLSGIDLRKSWVLDAGCGTGHASQRLAQWSHQVVSLDLGKQLIRITRARAGTYSTQGNILSLPFPDETFRLVFSTEVIEHTPDPYQAISEFWRVIKPGGWLSLSSPNRLWQGPVRLASRLGIRPYEGYENFLWPAELRRYLKKLGGEVLEHRGIHLLPFQFSPFQPLNTWLDQFGETLLPLMINQALLCRKPMMTSMT